MAYVPIDRFLVRAPLLAASPFGNAALRLMRDPLGARALALASSSLAAQSTGERAVPERAARARVAIDRYGRRAAFRATPAGLLAGVTVGALGARTGGATGEPRAHLAPSWGRMARFGRALLEEPAVRVQVFLRQAPSLLRGADRIRWLAAGTRIAEEREAELDPRLARILDACRDWRPWTAVRAAATGCARTGDNGNGDGNSDGDGDGPDADELLLLLIDDDLLHHDLAPPLVGPPAAIWMSARLATLTPPVSAAKTLARALAALDRGDLAAGRDALGQLPGADGEADPDHRVDDATPDVIATLVHQPSRPLTLDRATVERAARLAPLLFRLQEALAPPAAERLADRGARDALATASELFGEGTLDAAAWSLGDYGVDPSASDAHDDLTPAATRYALASTQIDRSPPAALLRWLVDEIASACAEQRAEIALDPAALDVLLPTAAPPPTCELFLAPTPRRTGWLLGLHAPAGASWGRFAGALGPALADAFVALDTAERQAQPHQRRLDVAYAPSPGLADLCAHPRVRGDLLALSSWPASDGDTAGRDGNALTVETNTVAPSALGLLVASDLDVPVLVTGGSGDGADSGEVIPSPLARVRSTTAPSGLYRLLAGFSLYRQHAPWALSLGALADLAYVPRISIDGFVISPASWRIPPELDARAFRRWRRGARAGAETGFARPPRFVQVGAEDELLPVDLGSAHAWRDLVGQPRAWEIWPPLDEGAPTPTRGVDRDGRRIEAVVALVDFPDAIGVHDAEARHRTIAAAGPVPPPRVAAAAPGWRTLALYGVEDRQDDVLLDAVAPTVRAALDAGEIDHWFFVRYADDRGRRPHLRLRVHAANRAHADAFAARLEGGLGDALASGAVTLVESCGYHPEIARFGGRDAMPAALHIFEADSELACTLLGDARSNGQIDAQVDVQVDVLDRLVATLDSLAAGLGFSQAQRHQIARRRRRAESATIAALDAEHPRALDGEFRARQRHLRAALGARPADDPITRRIDAYRARVGAAVTALSETARARLIAPLLHLSAVRLAGADRRAEARAYLFWERTLEGLERSPLTEPSKTTRRRRSSTAPTD